MKTCIHCGVSKPLDAFGAYKRSKDGHAAKCKKCRNEAARVSIDREAERARYNRDKAKHAPMRAAYRLANAEKTRAQVKRWREENPDRLRAHKKKYAAARVEKAQDGYMRSLLAGWHGGPLKPADIPPELVELKREQLTMRRMAQQLKKAIHECITNPARVPGQPGSSDNERRFAPDRGEQPPGAGAKRDQRD